MDGYLLPNRIARLVCPVFSYFVSLRVFNRSLLLWFDDNENERQNSNNPFALEQLETDAVLRVFLPNDFKPRLNPDKDVRKHDTRRCSKLCAQIRHLKTDGSKSA